MKDLRYSELNDIYGSLLTPHQSEVVKGYYDSDLSLSELAENLRISRQGVMDVLRTAENALDKYEKALRVSAIYSRLGDALNASDEVLRQVVAETIKNRYKE